MGKKNQSNWFGRMMSFILVSIILYFVYKTFRWLDETPEINTVDLEL